jgi:hypothetical protein
MKFLRSVQINMRAKNCRLLSHLDIEIDGSPIFPERNVSEPKIDKMTSNQGGQIEGIRLTGRNNVELRSSKQ